MNDMKINQYACNSSIIDLQKNKIPNSIHSYRMSNFSICHFLKIKIIYGYLQINDNSTRKPHVRVDLLWKYTTRANAMLRIFLYFILYNSNIIVFGLGLSMSIINIL